MPELPEVEVLVRHLQRVLPGREVRGVTVLRAKVVRPDDAGTLAKALVGREFCQVRRRAKYLLFDLGRRGKGDPKAEVTVVGHLGMTGRMFVQPNLQPLPKHAAVTLDLGPDVFVFEDTRYFGRFNLDTTVLEPLGPEPLEDGFVLNGFVTALRRSRQPIKVKLLDQTVIAGVGNIYASEALFRAGINPKRPALKLKIAQVISLMQTIREVLAEAIQFGSTIPLDLDHSGRKNDLFYYGQAEGSSSFYEERLLVYGRRGEPCRICHTPIRKFVQAARSTYWCPKCQSG